MNHTSPSVPLPSPITFPLDGDIERDIRAVFSMYDADKKGHLSRAEFSLAFLALFGYKASKYETINLCTSIGQHARATQLQRELEGEANLDEDTPQTIENTEQEWRITKDDFIRLCQRQLARSEQHESVRDCFKMFDSENKGFLTYLDFKKAVQSLGMKTPDHILQKSFIRLALFGQSSFPKFHQGSQDELGRSHQSVDINKLHVTMRQFSILWAKRMSKISVDERDRLLERHGVTVPIKAQELAYLYPQHHDEIGIAQWIGNAVIVIAARQSFLVRLPPAPMMIATFFQHTITTSLLFFFFVLPYYKYLHADTENNTLHKLAEHNAVVSLALANALSILAPLQLLILNPLVYYTCVLQEKSLKFLLKFTFLQQPIVFVATSAVFYLIVYLYDWTVPTSWTYILSVPTAQWSILVATFFTLPIFTVYMVNGKSDGISQYLFKHFWINLVVGLGFSWAGSFVFPLDWDKPWQTFPVNVTIGLFVSQVLLCALSLFSMTKPKTIETNKSKSE